MAQFNKINQDFLNQERSLFEVNMVANKNGEVVNTTNPFPVFIGGFGSDLFGRLKISEPFTLFDSSHIYQQDGDFDDVVVGTGSIVGFITAQSSATLTIGSTSGCSAVRESKRVFSYQPGKSLQVLQTFVFNSPKEGLVQRVGYASSENGVMLELDGSQINIIKRTGISGVGTTVTVPQSEWNQDTLDGNGPSKYTLDLTKAQILFTEYEWLGVGSVRVGFAIDGKFIIAHQFDHANHIDSVYMTTANLPIRYEIFNKEDIGSTSTMKQICASVQSNGGYEKKVAETFVSRTTELSNIETSYKPVVSMRLAPGREDAIIIPSQFGGFPLTANVNYVVSLIKNPSLTGAAFTSSTNPNVQYDTSATSMSGGEVVGYVYVASTNQARGTVFVQESYNWDLQLGRKQNKVSDIYTLAIRTLSGTGSGVGAIGFYDLT
jgi:hypothetical protein